MAKFRVIAPVEHVMGYLRYGHYEGELELTEEEMQKINENPDLLKEYDLNFVVDDYEIEGIGRIEADISFEECL